MASTKSDFEGLAACSAAEEVDIANIARYGPEGRSAFMFDPATRTLIVRPEADLIICKALRREARRIAFRLRLRQPLFEIQYLTLKVRYAILRLRCYLARNAPKFIFRSHDNRS
jgi:hypothetical protein